MIVKLGHVGCNKDVFPDALAVCLLSCGNAVCPFIKDALVTSVAISRMFCSRLTH